MKNLSSYWLLIGEFLEYPTLNALKYDLMTNADPAEFLAPICGQSAFHYVNGKVVAEIEVYTDDEYKWHFSRPVKC